MVACLLSFDTSTDVLAVALELGGEVRCRVEAGGAKASGRLLAVISELLAEAGVGYARVDAIAFGQGPGAFTGLRTACAVAQGLGLGLDRPVLAIDSLLIMAEDACQRPDWIAPRDVPTWVAMDARMDEVYAGCWQRRDGRWLASAPAALYTLPALTARWLAEPPKVVAGTAVQVFSARLPWGTASCCPPVHDRAGALARLGDTRANA